MTTTRSLTTNPGHKCHECGGEHFHTLELAPGVFADECLECGAELLETEPFEFIHPVQGVRSELNYEQNII